MRGLVYIKVTSFKKMGIIWPQPESSLKASLLDHEPELILRTGDLLMVPASDMEITLDIDPWLKVAVIVQRNKKVFAFCDGQLNNIATFLQQYPHTVCRPLSCVREVGFDRRVLCAVERTMATLSKRRDMNPLFREGFCVGIFLGIMGLVEWQALVHGKLRPSHFSTEDSRLQLKEYSSEQFTVM